MRPWCGETLIGKTGLGLDPKEEVGGSEGGYSQMVRAAPVKQSTSSRESRMFGRPTSALLKV